jgi:SPP1 family predicted phage head-tail adaptor
MNVGRLDRKVTIQQVARSRDVYGGWTETWSDFAVVWASITWQTAGERLNVARETSTTKGIFYIRYMDGITDDMRIVYGGNWDIIDVVYKDRRRSIEITAEKKDS